MDQSSRVDVPGPHPLLDDAQGFATAILLIGLGLAMLRSATPVQRGDHVFYYEVMLATAGTASLRRYQARPQGNGRRDQVAFALTHEALAKVAADVTANG